MTSGRTLENALASEGISKEFKEWIAMAKDRPKWRQQAHLKLKHSFLPLFFSLVTASSAAEERRVSHGPGAEP